MLDAAREADRRVGIALDESAADRKMARPTIQAVRTHLANTLLRDAGLIYYETNVDMSPLIERLAGC
jgi:hypothetical protein